MFGVVISLWFPVSLLPDSLVWGWFLGGDWSWKVGHQAEVLTYRPTSLAGKWTMNENSYGTPVEDRNNLQLAILVFPRRFLWQLLFFLGAAHKPYMISFLAMHKGVGRILEGQHCFLCTLRKSTAGTRGPLGPLKKGAVPALESENLFRFHLLVFGSVRRFSWKIRKSESS